MFLALVGGGIPPGVLLADHGGVPAWGTVALYLLSDIVLAFVAEPIFALLALTGRRVQAVGRLGQTIQAITARAGLKSEGVTGALGVVLVSFVVSPTTGRAAAASLGHGFLRGWSCAILGDMGYFVLLMASTLWLSSTLGNDRVSMVLAIAGAQVLPLALQRLRGRLLKPVFAPVKIKGARGRPECRRL